MPEANLIAVPATARHPGPMPSTSKLPCPPESLSHGQVTLRRWRLDDAAALLTAVIESEEHLRPWMSWAERYDAASATGFLRECQEKWAERTDFCYAIIAGDQIAGGAGLHGRVGAGGLEIGYWVHAARINRGIATDAAGALTSAALALPGIDRVEIYHDVANAASGRVPRKLGYVRIGEQPARGLWPRAAAESGTDVLWRLTRPAG
jgi:ribosomal-protein-serine acetyltransferase